MSRGGKAGRGFASALADGIPSLRAVACLHFALPLATSPPPGRCASRCARCDGPGASTEAEAARAWLVIPVNEERLAGSPEREQRAWAWFGGQPWLECGGERRPMGVSDVRNEAWWDI